MSLNAHDGANTLLSKCNAKEKCPDDGGLLSEQCTRGSMNYVSSE